jgi:uncharacterized membrane protein (TIGR01666 family)
MNKQFRAIRYFFFSQNFTDGLLTTMSVLLPALILSHFDLFYQGFMISLGALSVSITDSPGPKVHKRNGMLACCLTNFFVALITGFARTDMFLMAAEIAIFSFGFSMFAVYGNRAATVGTSALLIMILMMGQEIALANAPLYSALILTGGLWYTFLSILFIEIRPYLHAQQALGDCIHEVAKFMRLRSNFYSIQTDLEEDYQKVIAQQIRVSEKQDNVRELLFKSRQLVQESTSTSRLLFLTFVDVVDLYEQIMLINYDYAVMRERYGHTGVLDNIATFIREIAEELDNIGLAIQSNTSFPQKTALYARLEQLKKQIDQVSENNKEINNLPLKKLLVNLRNLVQRINAIINYYVAPQDTRSSDISAIDYSSFVSHQDFSIQKLRDNLTLGSSIFKYSLRIALVCMFGYTITQVFPLGHHSYWVLLTIIVILKPAFSLTRQRNFARLVGTVTGGLAGMLILYIFPDQRIQFALLVIFMLITFSFIRLHYIVSVIFMTPFILILFSFLGSGDISIAQERIIDTLIGSAIAFSASYLIFPSWESEQLQQHIQAMLKANASYLLKLSEALSGKEVKINDYKLARKEVYVSSANLGAAFQRMISEPKRKQISRKEVHKFVVLNHILSSYIAAVASNITDKEQQARNVSYLRPVKRAMSVLTETIRIIDPAYKELSINLMQSGFAEQLNGETDNKDENLLAEQLEFICKVSYDIRKSTEAIKIKN